MNIATVVLLLAVAVLLLHVTDRLIGRRLMRLEDRVSEML